MQFRKLIPAISIVAILAIPSVLALAPSIYLPKAFQDMLVFLFNTLPQGFQQSDLVAIVFFKFILWMLVFTVFYHGSRKLFKDDNKIAGTLGFLLSFVSVILMPNVWVKAIFETYSAIVSIVFALLPFFVAMYFNHKVLKGDEHWHQLFRGLIYIAISIVVFVLAATMEGGLIQGASSTVSRDLYENLAGWMGFAGAICLIAGLFNLMQAGNRRLDSGWGPSGSSPGKSPVKSPGKSPDPDNDEELAEEDESLAAISQEIKGIKDGYEKILSLKNGIDSKRNKTNAVAAVPTDWANIITTYNQAADSISAELKELEKLDELIKTHAKRIYGFVRRKFKKLTSRRARQNLDVAKRIYYEYRNVNKIEKMVENARKKLASTKNLPRITAKFTTPALGAHDEVEELDDVLAEIKTIYNDLVRLFKIEKVVMNEIT